MTGIRDDYGLTQKQFKFAQGAVSGLSLADSYRQAYDAENMSNKAIHVEACRLSINAKIALCMQSLSAEIQAKIKVITVSDRDMLITNLRRWTKGEDTPTSGQLRAAELLGKACGLYRDVIETRTERPASDILADIEARLNAMTLEHVKQSSDDDSNVDDNVH